MKKALALLATVAAGAFVWRKLADQRAERDLWAEVTDPLA